MLKIDNINASYGKIEVLQDISLEMNESDLIAVIGANGAGRALNENGNGLQTHYGTIVQW